MSPLIGKPPEGGLHLTPPTEKEDQLPAANRFLISQLKTDPARRGVVMVSPSMDPLKVEEYLSHPQVVGIKSYCTYSGVTPPGQAELKTFLPEWMWQIAERHHAAVLVHCVRSQALQDENNIQTLLEMGSKYSNVQILLDHAGRGFHAPNTMEGIRRLKDLKNLWADTSCICEPEGLVAIVKTLGHKKLLFGLDFPLCFLRGRAITAGTGFIWLKNTNTNWGTCRPVLLGIESIRAVFQAIDILGLDLSQQRDIFYNNAQQFLHL